ncbi:MAG: CaiB/BaiF CoA transferase family protein [Solirubrobacteraceae bacterium]
MTQSLHPLVGLRMIDFSSNIAGPYASMILAQLGADVIKVEPPAGDDARYYASDIEGTNPVHALVGAGKRDVVIDLKAPGGVEVALDLAAGADVVLQSMRPGVVDRLGIGREAVWARNPEVLYYDLNAFGGGEAGRRLPGYDPLVQAFSGIMEMTGHDESPPTRCAPSVVDLGTGQWVAMGILAALLARQRGQPVSSMETALVDTAFSLIGYQATSALVTGRRPPRSGSGNPIAAPYQCFHAGDGYLLIAAPSQRLWQAVIRALDTPHLLDDPRFATVADRSRHRHELEVALTAIIEQADVDTWIERLERERVPVGRVNGLEEAVRSPVVTERETFITSDGVPVVRLPWLADGEPLRWQRPAPGLGEHTVPVLRELGYSEARIDELLAEGAVMRADPPPERAVMRADPPPERAPEGTS